ncbi:hypothetical protein K9L27_02620 [Candidatus Gracilibacteria bacterium]|nr:hypothetical protein [Candidatus Gracilibacteria bacterium]
MKTQVTQLLSELLKSHPELAGREADLRKFIEEFLKSRPNANINDSFKKALRKEILARCGGVVHSNNAYGGWGNFFHFYGKPFAAGILLAGAAFVVLPMIMSPSSGGENNKAPEHREMTNSKMMAREGTEESLASDASEEVALATIEEKSANAFGTLEMPEMASSTRPQSGGGGMGMGGGGGMGIMPPYDPYGRRINHEYVYEGDMPQLTEEVFVYHKKKDVWRTPFDISQFNFPHLELLDVTTLKNLEIENLSLVEDREMGYSLSLNFRYPSLSLYQNYPSWEKYYQALNRCKNGYCPGPEPLKKSDMLPDNELIRIANAFLKTYGMKHEFWGTPKVKKYWEEAYYQGPTEPDFWPDELQVFYPYVVDGAPLMDNYGNELGTYISVNMRFKKVTSASMEPLFLESSKYVVNSKEDILKVAHQGGMQGISYASPDETVTLKLSDPRLQLTLLQKYGENNQVSDEYFVPALVFPIQYDDEKNKDQVDIQPYYSRPQSVIVPLVKDIVKKEEIKK